MTTRKPKINEKSLPWLREIDAFVRELDLTGSSLREHAGGDALDGRATRAELDDLIRRRLLKVVPMPEEKPECPPEIRDRCGTTWSVDVTERAVRAFWPDRA